MNSQGRGGRSRTVLAVVLLSGIATTIAMAGGGEETRRVRFIPSSRWGWVNSGVWNGESVIVVDALGGRGREFRLSQSGTEMREVGGSHLLPEGSLRIQQSQGGYLVQVSGTGFLRLGGDLRRTGKIDLEEPAKPGAQGRIQWVFSWAPLGKKALLAFGEVATERRERIKGFLWVPLDDPSGFKILHRVTDPSAWIYYKVGYPYVASTAGLGYFVDMAPRPARLYEVDRDGTSREVKLKDAGEELEHRGAVSEGEGPDRAKTLYAQLQAAAMPAGIYGFGEDLFLLRREPEGSGSRWTLTRFDRGSGAFLAAREIQSGAAHLTVIPGTVFAVLEKGPVRGVGQQEITGALLVPRGAIP